MSFELRAIEPRHQKDYHSFFPQVIKTDQTKSTGDLSLPMCSLMFAGTVSWLVYGLLKHDLPVTLANAVSSLASFVIFYYKIKEVRTVKKKLS